MAPRVTPWRARVDEILSDGRWHFVDDVVNEARRHVPPAQAYRRGEAMRKRQGGPEERALGNERTSIMVGEKAIARDAVRDNATLETTGDGDRKMVRLKKMTIPTDDIDAVRSGISDAITILESVADRNTSADVKTALGCLLEVSEKYPLFGRLPEEVPHGRHRRTRST